MKAALPALSAAAMLVVAGLYVAFRGMANEPPPATLAAAGAQHAMPHGAAPQPPDPARQTLATAAAPTDTPTYRLAIARTTSHAGTLLQARQGDTIRLVFLSDVDGTVEVHGYQRNVAVAAGVETTLLLEAQHAGRFPLHLHARDGAHIEVASLEVRPR
jgi:hypothetical protein